MGIPAVASVGTSGRTQCAALAYTAMQSNTPHRCLNLAAPVAQVKNATPTPPTSFTTLAPSGAHSPICTACAFTITTTNTTTTI